MKISASQSLLLATLAVSSSSSALVAPSGNGQPESVVNASSSSALPSSTSSDSLGPKESGLAEHDAFPGTIAERSLLNTVGCTLAQLGNSLVPLPILNDLLCAQGAREGSESSVNQDKVHAELHHFSKALNRAAFATVVSGEPSPTSSSNSSSTSSDVNTTGIPSNSSRVESANTSANATDASASPFISSSMSSASIWRAQPTPANSPSLPVDSPPPQSSTANSTASAASGGSEATSSATT